MEIEIPFHQQLNVDHQHLLDRYNDGEELVEHRCKQHDKAKKHRSSSSLFIQTIPYLTMKK